MRGGGRKGEGGRSSPALWATGPRVVLQTHMPVPAPTAARGQRQQGARLPIAGEAAALHCITSTEGNAAMIAMPGDAPLLPVARCARLLTRERRVEGAQQAQVHGVGVAERHARQAQKLHHLLLHMHMGNSQPGGGGGGGGAGGRGASQGTWVHVSGMGVGWGGVGVHSSRHPAAGLGCRPVAASLPAPTHVRLRRQGRQQGSRAESQAHEILDPRTKTQDPGSNTSKQLAAVACAATHEVLLGQ